ncbi:MAG: hypothetical protein IJA91_05785 [Clostridia bacterium]|nr:hypothetical protein [Clostridia bacterium]
MTSKDSLAGKRKFFPLLHELIWSVRRYWWVTLVGFLLFGFLTIGAMTLEGNKPDTFALFSNAFDPTLIRVAAVLYGLFTAFCLFRFLWSRKECGMYLTVGAARWKQFTLRYLFGFLSVAVAVVAALLLTYHSEMTTIPEDYYGLAAHYTTVFTISLATLTLLSYSFGVLVAVLCGHFLPALLCSAGVLAAPYTVAAGITNLVSFFLHGSPLGASSMVSYADEFPNFFTRSMDAGLFTMLADDLWYVTFSDGFLARNDNPNAVTSILLYKEEHALPTLTLILLLGITVTLAVLAGFAYCHRPAEHSGKHYVHPVLSHATALSLAFGAASCVFLLKSPAEGGFGTVLLTALFLIALVIASALIRLLLIRDLKATLRHYPVLCGVAVLCLATVLCLGTGWFGYADFLPEAGEVASVTVSYNQNPTLLNVSGRSSFSRGKPQTNSSFGISDGTLALEFLYCYGFTYHYDSLPILTQPEDVAAAIAIHEAILADGRQVFTGEMPEDYARTVVPVDFYISYELKNGKTVTRYYPYLSLATLETVTMATENTYAYREEMAAYHENVGYMDMYPVEIGDPLFGTFHTPTLTEEGMMALMVALDTDTALMTAEERYYGDHPVLGIIRIRTMQSTKLSTHPFDRAYETYYVTENFQNTLAFLREWDLDAYFTADATITEIRVQRYTPRFLTVSGGHALSYVFFACDNNVQLYVPDNRPMAFEDWIGGGEALPATEWDIYLQNSRSVALLTRPGRMVQIILTNAEGEQKLVTRYIYESDIPTGE